MTGPGHGPSEQGRPSALARFVARHRDTLVLRKVAGLCRRYLSWHSNANYDAWSNGEAFVLETLSRYSPRVLFDAGANVGDWSRMARRLCPSAGIHAFEISPPTFDRLLENTRGDASIRCRNVGLSDQPGTVTLHHYDDYPALTTASDYPHPFAFSSLEATVTTGDAYARENAIEHIDLLKIDVEGMEHQVLNGVSELLSRRAIDLVQFEYGRVNILSHFLLRDFHRFFGDRGYRVGKMYPRHVEFREYELEDEDFIGPNYLACREELAELLERLRG